MAKCLVCGMPALLMSNYCLTCKPGRGDETDKVQPVPDRNHGPSNVSVQFQGAKVLAQHAPTIDPK